MTFIHQFSLSNDNSWDRRNQNSFNTTKQVFRALPFIMTTNHWSPIAWSQGKRLRKNFLSTSLMAFDFDDGRWEISDAQAFFSRVSASYLIGTTKSHQKEKGKEPPCDRFRVVVEAELCMSLLDYEYTMKEFMAEIPCDKSCKDGARFFWRCQEIVTENYGGTPLAWMKARKQVIHPVEFSTTKPKSPLNWPGDVMYYLTKPQQPGGRHKAVFRVAAALTRQGYKTQEIFDLCKESPSLMAIGVSDVERQIEWGRRTAQSEYDDWREGRLSKKEAKEYLEGEG